MPGDAVSGWASTLGLLMKLLQYTRPAADADWGRARSAKTLLAGSCAVLRETAELALNATAPAHQPKSMITG